MSNKKVRLTEADLNRLVKKVIEEQNAIQNATNYIGGALKSGANAINNATGGVAGKVANKVVDTAKSVGNAITSNAAKQQQLKANAAKNVQKAYANQRIQALAKTLKQYTPQELAAAQKLNAGGGVSPTPRPVAAKPQAAPVKPQAAPSSYSSTFGGE